RRLAVPGRDILDEAHTFTLDGRGDDDNRLSQTRFSFLERLNYLLHIVAVNGENLPTEGAIFGLERIDIHDVAHPAVDLQAVVINDADQVVELMMTGLHGGFPDLPLLLLAVAHDAERPVIFPVELAGQRNAHGYAESLSQRSCRNLYTRKLEPVRMALISRPQLAQKHDVIHRAKAGKG